VQGRLEWPWQVFLHGGLVQLARYTALQINEADMASLATTLSTTRTCRYEPPR
jgi:hypothetical protein